MPAASAIVDSTKQLIFPTACAGGRRASRFADVEEIALAHAMKVNGKMGPWSNPIRHVRVIQY
jgi:hypothetical protein